jgi:hypothetical protein
LKPRSPETELQPILNRVAGSHGRTKALNHHCRVTGKQGCIRNCWKLAFAHGRGALVTRQGKLLELMRQPPNESFGFDAIRATERRQFNYIDPAFA